MWLFTLFTSRCLRYTFKQHNLVFYNRWHLNFFHNSKQYSEVYKKSAVKTSESSAMEIDAHLFKTAKAELLQIFDSSVTSVLPGAIIDKKVKLDAEGNLVINNNIYPLSNNVYLVGFGKAVAGMAFSLEKILGDKLKCGIISVPPMSLTLKKGELQELKKETEKQLQNLQMLKRSDIIKFCEGAENNQPDAASFHTTEKIIELVQDLGEDDTIIVLISGGGSALFFHPKAPLTIHDKRHLCRDLQNAGASITELNCIRKQLSSVKGGGFAKIVYPAKVLALVLSDIVGDPLESIASGPTCPSCAVADQTKAIEILKKYNLFKSLDPEIKKVLINLDKTYHDENENMVKEGKFKHVENIIIGNNETALHVAKEASRPFDMESVILSSSVEGDVEHVSYAYAKLTSSICRTLEKELPTYNDFFTEISSKNLETLNITEEKFKEAFNICKELRKGRSLLLLGGGEPTVVVKGNGKGGRNQELALRFSIDWLSEIEKDPSLVKYFVLFLSAGTDGQDGPTDAAGAFGKPAIRPKIMNIYKNIKEAIKLTPESEELENLKYKFKQIKEMLPENVLKRNDAYNFYKKFENGINLVKTGLTGTNVMDLHFIYIKRRDCECDIQSYFKCDCSWEDDCDVLFDELSKNCDCPLQEQITENN